MKTLIYFGCRILYKAIIDCRVHSELITGGLRSVVFAEINKDCSILDCIWVRRQE